MHGPDAHVPQNAVDELSNWGVRRGACVELWPAGFSICGVHHTYMQCPPLSLIAPSPASPLTMHPQLRQATKKQPSRVIERSRHEANAKGLTEYSVFLDEDTEEARRILCHGAGCVFGFLNCSFVAISHLLFLLLVLDSATLLHTIQYSPA
jgi:hypothetical protein